MARWAFALVVCLMFSGVASGQDSADYTIEEITYYFAAGTHTSGHMTLGMDYTGANQTDFEGCVHMILRDKPEKNDVGRIQVIGKYNDQFINIDISSFEGHLAEMDGGIAQDIYVDGSRLHVGKIQHPTVMAGIATWGTGVFDVGMNPYYDPVTGRGEYQTSLFVTPNGFRDDKTGAITSADGGPWEPGMVAKTAKEDWEVHLRVESIGDARQADWEYGFEMPGDDLGYFEPNEGYSDVFVFDNVRFGGTATVTVEAEALERAGENSLTFTLRDPHGDVLDQTTLEPAVLDDQSYSVDMPLEHFGKYSLEAAGTVSLSKYSVSVTQRTPSSFDMGFWWDAATFGPESTKTLWDCQDEVGYPEELVASVIPRVPPPPFDWVTIGFALGASVLGLLIAGKLVHMSAVAHRRK